ncbi:MAG: hypothetical protein EVJ47_05375 [Candidatus Acidulodesulfobacterium ferriphilum]|uniref:Uncharacterized protein n=1 Tax=Candidatus Acidulodesulfobacterium ferriphilum TaxID=2597223 RepID=A0A519BBE0_9DELT|nr:MAG: hypothetical protein EVJ47_05375 [Candidatus Acidulodesulfobacterium ferriphilum]
MKTGYTRFKIHRGIHDRVTRFGLEIYDWGLFIFITMILILAFKEFIILAILIDMLILIFLRKYKNGKPDFYTSSLLSFILIKKELFILEPGSDKLDAPFLNLIYLIYKDKNDAQIRIKKKESK